MAQCDPKQHFTFNTKLVKLTDDIAYWAFQESEVAKSEANKKGSGLEFELYGVPVKLNYDEASQVMSRFRLKTASGLRHQQSQVMFEKTLTDDSLKAYIECLRGASPVVVRIKSISDDWNNVSFEVEWSVLAKQVTSAAMKIKVHGGTFSDGSSEFTKSDWGKGDRDVFVVDRTGAEEILLVANIDGQAAESRVPTKPVIEVPNVVKKDVELVGLIRGEYYGNDIVEGMVRIDADPGTVLLPSTASVLPMLKYSSRTDRPIDEILFAEVVEATPLYATFRTRNLHGNNAGRSIIQGRAFVYQVGNWT